MCILNTLHTYSVFDSGYKKNHIPKILVEKFMPEPLSLRDACNVDYVFMKRYENYLITEFIYNTFLGKLCGVTVEDFGKIIDTIKDDEIVVLDLTKRSTRDVSNIISYI